MISLESITVQLKSKNESLENAIAKIEQNNNITNERNFNELTSQINMLKASSQPQSQRGDMNRQSITNHIQREIRSWGNVDENDSATTTDLMWQQRPQYYSDNTPNDDNTPTRDILGDFTHFNANDGQSTVDLAFISEDFFKNISKFMIFPQSELSDHCKIVVEIPNLIINLSKANINGQI